MSNRTSAQQRIRSTRRNTVSDHAATTKPSADAAGEALSPCAASMAVLAGAQSHTHDLITELERRLESVLSGEETRGPSDIPSGVSPLHAELNHRLANAEGHNIRLRDLIDRLAI